MPRTRAGAVLVVAATLVLTAAISCTGQGDVPQASSAQTGGAPFTGDSTSDSALTAYAREVPYELLSQEVVQYADTQGVRGTLDLCVGAWATSIPFGDLQDGNWRRIGCVIRTGAEAPDWPFIRAGVSFFSVRRSAGNWQVRFSGLLPRTLVVSTTDTRPTLNADAKRFLEGPRPYLCYTCDRKACCVQSVNFTDAVQAQTDVDHIATIW